MAPGKGPSTCCVQSRRQRRHSEKPGSCLPARRSRQAASTARLMFLAPSRDGAGGSEATAVLEEDGVCAHPGSWAGRALQVHVLQAPRPLLPWEPPRQPQRSSPTASVVTCHADAAPEDVSLSSVTLRALGSHIVLKLLLKTGKSTWEPPRETEWGLLCTWARREPLTCGCISGADGCRDPQPRCPQPGGVGMWLVSWYHLIPR